MSNTEIAPRSSAAIAPTGGIDLSAAIQAAAALGKDGVEVMERLHKIAQEERASNARAAFNSAVADLHGRIGSIPKNRTASFLTKGGSKVTYRYADLHAIATALRKHTGALGLSWRWSTVSGDRGEVVTCHASHRDGHSESATWAAPIEGGNPLTSDCQKAKIATTFAQRVTLIQVFGLTDTEDDIDGAMPVGEVRGDGPDTDAPHAPSDGRISEAQVANLAAIISEAPDADEEARKFLAHMNVSRLAEIHVARHEYATKLLEKRRSTGWGAKA